MDSERTAWDARYREGSHRSLDPDPFLLQAHEDFIRPLFPNGGEALDVAGGIGRHALWLAQHDWKVDLIDISQEAIALAGKNAESAKLNCQLLDLDDFKAKKQYDLVLVFFFLQRAVFPELIASLRPGGILLYKTYTHLQPKFRGGPSHPMHLLEENELLRAFSSLKILHYRETIRERGVAELVAQKT